MRVRSITFLIACCCHLWVVLSAHAQTLRGTVIIPEASGTSLDASAEQTVDRIEAALKERPVGIISLHEARDRFVAWSRPPTGAEEGDVDVLAREARAALEHVAFGRTQAAQKSVKEVLSRAERALESLNRETATARQVLDACLALVRAELHRDDRAAALVQAASCRRLVPDVAPNQSLHPANVIGALAEADDQMRRLRTGRLHVISKPGASCAVYVNGRHLGTTPFTLERAVAGQYRVQVECSAERGRVHMVTLGDTPVELAVDSQLDHAIRSEPRLHFAYGAGRVNESLAQLHAMEVGRLIGAEQVVQVRSAGDFWVLSRLTVSGGRLVGRSRVTKREPLDRQELEKALDELWQGRIDNTGQAALVAGSEGVPTTEERASDTVVEGTAPTSETSDESSDTSPTPSSEAGDAPRWMSLKHGLGLGVAAIAAASWATGLVFEAERVRKDDELTSLSVTDPRVPGLQKEYDRASEMRWIGVGGALGVVAAPLLVKPREMVPWWGYAISAAGAGVVAVGVVELLRSDTCELTGEGGFCIQARNSAGRGALMVAGGLPLVSVLPAQLVLRRFAQAPALSARIDRHAVALALTFVPGGR